MNPSGMADDVIAALEAAGIGRPVAHNWWEAVCTGIIKHVKENMDILPKALTGENLSAPTGQPVVIPATATPGNPSDGATTEDTELVGMGSAQ